jgi:hypothetical protein
MWRLHDFVIRPGCCHCVDSRAEGSRQGHGRAVDHDYGIEALKIFWFATDR